MAQSNYTPISLYYSIAPGAQPVNTNLVDGELAINIKDGKLYYKDDTGTVQLLASKATATGPAGGNTQIQFNNNNNFGASANLTWDGTTLGVTGALSVSADSSFTSTGALLISKGTTLEQPGAPATGMIRYNTTSNEFEGYSGGSPTWKSIGGSALSNDTSTASNLYPVFAAATTGTAQNLYTSNAKYLYKPSTGDLQAEQLVAKNGIVVNSQTIATSYTIDAGYNASSTGPVTVNGGVTVTVASGSRWVVL